jgi:hypothetical protein
MQCLCDEGKALVIMKYCTSARLMCVYWRFVPVRKGGDERLFDMAEAFSGVAGRLDKRLSGESERV